MIRFAFPLRQGSEDCGVHVEYAVVVLGVPTFINDERAVLVAITAGPSGDGALATITINRVVDLLDSFNDLNEFKQTRIAR